MCGIAGAWSAGRELDPETGVRAAGMLYHRGPDDQRSGPGPHEGTLLLATRLSIQDLSPTAHQPMWSGDRRTGVAFNGEIYNFRELRGELERAGHRFRSSGDTEVLLRGFQEWGVDVLPRLNGMFAAALWDGRARTLWLVRDRLGEKPLYYWHEPSTRTLVFASEIKSLLVWPWIPRRVDTGALHTYLALGHVPAPRTMFEEVRKVVAGGMARYDGERLELRRWWVPPQAPPEAGDPDRRRKEVREHVVAAVESRLVSDVPVAATLSGGVDSSTVVGIATRLLGRDMVTVTTAFEAPGRAAELDGDDRAALEVSRIFGTKHLRVVVPLDGDLLAEELRRMAWQLDEPVKNPSCIAMSLLARELGAQGLRVLLTGDGSDELFGGYQRYLDERVLAPVRADRCGPRAPGLGDRLLKLLERTAAPVGSPAWYLGWWRTAIGPEERLRLLEPELGGESAAPEAAVRDALDLCTHGGAADRLALADLLLWITDASNLRSDKMTMAHSVEARAPFLDHRLAEYALGVPFDEKVGPGDLKWLLKGAFADLLPKVVTERPKWGWISPVEAWISGPLRPLVERAVEALPNTGLFRPEVAELAHPAHGGRRSGALWLLAILSLWYDAYVEPLGLRE
ncbi:MAG TPA: asparagine synthase (glutamine-hydrolyzing) [Longimicrobiaceae bacterium]|nr:asparagine synthase (glutamine-hydrolyzing) [Longimicrobiaceae bacterium]